MHFTATSTRHPTSLQSHSPQLFNEQNVFDHLLKSNIISSTHDKPQKGSDCPTSKKLALNFLLRCILDSKLDRKSQYNLFKKCEKLYITPLFPEDKSDYKVFPEDSTFFLPPKSSFLDENIDMRKGNAEKNHDEVTKTRTAEILGRCPHLETISIKKADLKVIKLLKIVSSLDHTDVSTTKTIQELECVECDASIMEFLKNATSDSAAMLLVRFQRFGNEKTVNTIFEAFSKLPEIVKEGIQIYIIKNFAFRPIFLILLDRLDLSITTLQVFYHAKEDNDIKKILMFLNQLMQRDQNKENLVTKRAIATFKLLNQESQEKIISNISNHQNKRKLESWLNE